MWERFVVLLVWLVQQVGRKIFFHLVKEGWNACCDEPFRQQIKKILRFIGSLPIFVLALVPTVLAGTSVFVLVVFLPVTPASLVKWFAVNMEWLLKIAGGAALGTVFSAIWDLIADSVEDWIRYYWRRLWFRTVWLGIKPKRGKRLEIREAIQARSELRHPGREERRRKRLARLRIAAE